ncbi:MAG: leader peptidase (prepilin peptidase)/N-methyltransferase [Planctomycetota bacterium]|jgi:leader peptidase (prepilin peptidase)/N-methyltransferase
MPPMVMNPTVWIVWWTAVGLCVGSFLNVCIHRWPLENETVSSPKRSRCPSCRHELSWKENIPVFSWIALRGRCRWCKCSISARYPGIELLTGILFLTTAWIFGPSDWALTMISALVLAGLVVATFVDFDRFEIPDEVSIGGMILAPILSALVPGLHASTWVAQRMSEGEGVDRFGALFGSLAGLAVGGGILLLIGWIGKLIYGRDAMGLGDVKLLAAGGGFVGPGGALVALLIGSFVASAVGILNMARFLWISRSRVRQRGGKKSFGRSVKVARICGRYLPFGPYLAIGIGIVLLAWNHVLEVLRGFVG